MVGVVAVLFLSQKKGEPMRWVLFAMLAGCAVPKAGDPCQEEGSMACESQAVSLVCEDGSMRRINCRGAGGCISDGNRVSCDTSSGVKPGDPCLKSQTNSGQCSASTDQALLCNGEHFVPIACKSCSVKGDRFICTPQAGGWCSSLEENTVRCSPDNPDEALKCTQNAYVSVACKGCHLQGLEIYCYP
jgi:hypothetical protein